MTKYDWEAIWRRTYRRMGAEPAKKFQKAKSDEEREKILKDVFRNDKYAKNLLKMQKSNFQNFIDHAISDFDGQTSLKKFSPQRVERIREIKQKSRSQTAREIAISRAEAKGIKITTTKGVTFKRGRPSTQKLLMQNVKIVEFTQGKNRYVAVYARGTGRRGLIAKQKI